MPVYQSFEVGGDFFLGFAHDENPVVEGGSPDFREGGPGAPLEDRVRPIGKHLEDGVVLC